MRAILTFGQNNVKNKSIDLMRFEVVEQYFEYTLRIFDIYFWVLY